MHFCLFSTNFMLWVHLQALCGLTRCESVKQIISKLPTFNNGQIQFLTRAPIMQDRRKQHARFCKSMEELTGKFSLLQAWLFCGTVADCVEQIMPFYLFYSESFWKTQYCTHGFGQYAKGKKNFNLHYPRNRIPI